MENQNSKNLKSASGVKQILLRLWTFGKREKPVYNLRSVRLPRVSGRTLKILSLLLRTPGIRSLLFPIFLWQTGISGLRRCQVKDEPLMHPLHPAPPQTSATAAKESVQQFFDSTSKNPESSASGGQTPDTSNIPQSLFHPETAFDFHKAYLEKITTPMDVALRLLDVIRSIEESAVPLRPLVAWDERELMRQAKTSADRYERGEPFGLLDGVPVAVKDELDLLPFPTMVGTKFYGTQPPTQDATVVSRLRSAGALMLGKTNMHEIGLGITGLNTNYGTTRNPYHLDHYPGGSSSGSAAAVAAGLCPIALGVDGGGSIRIPAGLCGIVGLKTTWGRVSSAGSVPLSWSVATVGPMATSARDAALAYALLAGPDSKQHWTQNWPPVDLERFDDANLEGVRLGYFSPWCHHASADIVQSCERMADVFKSQGATVLEIEIPELEAVQAALMVTITTEMVTSLQSHLKRFRSPFTPDTLINLILAQQFSGQDYVKAQRVRALLIKNLQQVFKKIDAVITPATACTAPRILPDALINGESDFSILSELMRYATPANLSGFPAIACPVGYDAQGLPVGMQLMGRAWEESLLLRLANISEQFFTRQPPMMRFSLLPD